VYPGFAPIAVTSPWGFGNYHSLQLQAVKRTTRGLSVVANFVEGRCMDNTSVKRPLALAAIEAVASG